MFRRGGGFGGYGRVGWGAILHYVLHDKLAVGSTETLGRAGNPHRVWMTGNQPEHDPWLPRSCAPAERAACIQCRTLVLLMSRGGGFRVWRLWWVRSVIELRSMARRGVRALRPMATHGNGVAGNERPLHSGRDDDEPLAEERFIGRSVSGITRPRLRWVRQMTVSHRS
jgi:hypothetical protein